MRYTVDGIGVEFIWDNGDPSVGIRGGWDDCCIILPGPAGIETIIGFEVTNGEVAEWPLSFVGLLKHGERIAAISDEFPNETTVGGMLPQVLAAVSRVWDKVNADEFIETLGENLWHLESHIDDLRWQLRESTMDGRQPYQRELDEIAMWKQELSADKVWYEWARVAYQHDGFGEMERED